MAKNRILIVEDDAAIAESIALNLDLSGYDYLVLGDGQDVVDLLCRDHSFDLALLDVMLPGLDGFRLMEHMQRCGIPALYLTAKADVSSRVKGLRNGAEDYIVKPFEVLELLVRMEKVLERTGKMRQILEVGELSINLLERSVRKHGKEIFLKPMEFDLLVMLAKNKNIALSRERLLHGVWGVEYQGETRTVDVHIAQLRKKLGLEEQIRTITKLGYRLED